uniref:Uncharacterized protein n=1 Tax=Brassica oleracea TaxID=3712 RepID=A0A3P6H3D2_BRAOL|nr:unnamed protein product [Brassica oleracea]
MAVPKKNVLLSRKSVFVKKNLEKEGILDIVESFFFREITFYR